MFSNLRIGHGYSQTCKLNHGQVVESVAHSHHFFRFHAQLTQ